MISTAWDVRIKFTWKLTICPCVGYGLALEIHSEYGEKVFLRCYFQVQDMGFMATLAVYEDLNTEWNQEHGKLPPLMCWESLVNQMSPTMTQKWLPPQGPLWYLMDLVGLLYSFFSSPLTVALSLLDCQEKVKKRVGDLVLQPSSWNATCAHACT